MAGRLLLACELGDRIERLNAVECPHGAVDRVVAEPVGDDLVLEWVELNAADAADMVSASSILPARVDARYLRRSG